jgi:hypothetical protein
MKVAIFNGFLFHYEMFGYLIDFCSKMKYELTVYWGIGHDHGYRELYTRVFSDYKFIIRGAREFLGMTAQQRSTFDIVFLITDDDYEFDKSNLENNRKTICIEHFYKDRCPLLTNKIATRPFASPYLRDWALPCYSILCSGDKRIVKLSEREQIHIAIIGSTIGKYNTAVMNRIKFMDKPIIFHVIGRDVERSQFDGLDNLDLLNIYHNIDTLYMMRVIDACQFVLTDHIIDNKYENEQMSGSIPLAFSLLVPLIISSQTNQYYKFENVIEFNKTDGADIILHDIDVLDLETERDAMVLRNHNMFKKHIDMTNI